MMARYPFPVDEARSFEESLAPKILDVDWQQVIKRGDESEITVLTSNADSVRYYVTDARGNLTETGIIQVDSGMASVKFDCCKYCLACNGGWGYCTLCPL